ncbi:MAG: hypothetical protein QM723_12135 [Myxococcaceae bacterium]
MSSPVAAQVRDASSGFGSRALGWVRAHVLPLVSVGAFVTGAVCRSLYILVHHHPRNSVTTDAIPIANLAELFADPLGQQQFFHTIWPPGEAALLALTLPFDPTLGLAAVLQLLASLAIPWLALLVARWTYGPKAGWIGLLLASGHFGLIYYGGFFLSEQLFQLAVAVAVCVSIAAVRSESRPVLSGVAVGAAWAFTALFRSNALPIAAFALLWLTARWWLGGLLARRWRTIAAAVATVVVLMAPLAHRCSSLLGRFCPGSSNAAMNVALGHAPPGVVGLTFAPQSAELSTGPNTWTPPGRMQLGYTEYAQVPGSIYDTGAVLGWVLERLRDDPVEFLLGSLGNAIDLFATSYWPDDYTDLPSRRVTLLKQAMFVFVLVPGLAFFGLLLLRVWRRHDIGDPSSLLAALLLGMFLLACATLGEARYRLPFDLVLIVFAARAYSRTAGQGDRTPARAPACTLAISAPALATLTLLLSAVAHPQLKLAARLSGVARRLSAPATQAATLADLSTRRAPGTPWDTPGVQSFVCRVSACPELRISLPSRSNAPAIEVSGDHNDRYRVTFYRGGNRVSATGWGISESAPAGLQPARITVPEAARAGGFDAVGVQPMYGDGRYAVGHLSLLPR